MLVNRIIKTFAIVFAMMLLFYDIGFAAKSKKEDLTVGPGVEEMQIAGAVGSGYPQTVTSNGLTVIPDFDNPMHCSLKVSDGVTVHYNIPRLSFNFLDDPSKNAFVNEQFNFLISYNMTNILSNNYKNNGYSNLYSWCGNTKRKNWTMNKVGLKDFDGNIIEIEYASPDYRRDGMVRVKATYDIANNTMTLG